MEPIPFPIPNLSENSPRPPQNTNELERHLTYIAALGGKNAARPKPEQLLSYMPSEFGFSVIDRSPAGFTIRKTYSDTSQTTPTTTTVELSSWHMPPPKEKHMDKDKTIFVMHTVRGDDHWITIGTSNVISYNHHVQLDLVETGYFRLSSLELQNDQVPIDAMRRAFLPLLVNSEGFRTTLNKRLRIFTGKELSSSDLASAFIDRFIYGNRLKAGRPFSEFQSNTLY